MDVFWDWLEDLLDAAGGWLGVITGFALPLVAMGMAVWTLAR